MPEVAASQIARMVPDVNMPKLSSVAGFQLALDAEREPGLVHDVVHASRVVGFHHERQAPPCAEHLLKTPRAG